MINNYSVVDGLRAIMGNLALQVAMLVTVLVYARPVDFETSALTDRAEQIFW